MKRLSPEYRIGIIAVIIIILFLWLFSFLKGRNLFSNYDHYTINYDKVAGLVPSSPVEISGLKAGIVNSVELINDGSGMIEVLISIENNYKIPENSMAEITTASLIAGMKINIKLGDSMIFLKSGDEIQGRLAISILDKFDPLAIQTSNLILNLDSLIGKLNILFTPEFSNNISQSAENLEEASKDFQTILKSNSGELGIIIDNLKEVSLMLGQNIERIDSTIVSVNNISSAISNSEIDSTLTSLKVSLENSSSILEKLNNNEGSAGKFLNDDSLYIKLTNSMKSLEILLKDIEENPGKYVQFSIFGKKKE